jgi:hypothetical protein
MQTFPFDVKEHDEDALVFALHLFSFLGLGDFQLSVNGSRFFPERLLNHF